MSSTQKSSFSSAKRVLATVASAAMLFALLPAGIALGASPDNVCPPPDGVETFPDVDTGVHADNVECAAGYDIVNGYPDGEYKPGLDVFRAQMATFIVNTIEAATGEAMPAGDNAFDDDDSSTHHANINKLAEAGIVQGQGGDYNPARKVNRAAMATFIANAIDYVDDQDPSNNSVLPAAAMDHFIDDEQSPHEENINRLADAGVVEGVSAGQYDPEVIVFRGQMASFVIESASYLEEQGLWAANDEAPTTPSTNEDYTLTPDEEATNTTAASEPNVGDDRQYSSSGLTDGTTYRIELVPAENVTVDENGVVTFSDTDGTGGAGNDRADDLGNTNAFISVVNGASSGSADGADETTATPVNGNINFTVDYNGTNGTESIIPVIYVDADSDTHLDLDADNQPTEEFGIGGQKTWIPGEAADGANVSGEVLIHNAEQDYLVIDDNDGATTVYYDDPTDTFRYEDAEPVQTLNITKGQFEGFVNADTADSSDGDSVSVPNYSRLAGSQFTLTADYPFEVKNLDADTGDFDADTDDEQDDDARFTWDAATNGWIDTYTVTVYRDDPNSGSNNTADCTDGTNVKSTSVNGTSTTADVEELSDATDYCAVVTSTSESGESGQASDPVYFSIATTAADAGAPTLQDFFIETDSAPVGFVDSQDDTIIFEFSEAMDSADIIDDGYVRISDGDSTYQITCGSNATCTGFNAGESTANSDGIKMTTNGALVFVSGTDNGLSLPATLSSFSNDWTDIAGNAVDVGNSPDKTLDNEGKTTGV